jgi:hypothetical protein
MVHRELQSLVSVDEGDGDRPSPVFSRPFGSEPRNVNPDTGQTVPPSEEQEKEILDQRALRTAIAEARNEISDKQLKDKKQAATPEVKDEHREAARKAVEEEQKKTEEERKANEQSRKSAVEEATEAQKRADFPGVVVPTASSGAPRPASGGEHPSPQTQAEAQQRRRRT